MRTKVAVYSKTLILCKTTKTFIKHKLNMGPIIYLCLASGIKVLKGAIKLRDKYNKYTVKRESVSLTPISLNFRDVLNYLEVKLDIRLNYL